MIFCYECEAIDAIVERDFPIGQAPPTVMDHGLVFRRSYRAEGRKHGGVKREDGVKNTGKAIWPMKSDALGCAPSQIPEFREVTRKYGCSTDYTPDGRAIVRSRGHRKKLLKLHGQVDKNGGYGD